MKPERKYIIPYLIHGLKGQLVQDLREEFESADWVEDIEIFNKGAIWTYAGYADDDLCIPLGEGEFSGFLIKHGKGTYTSVGNSIKPILRPLSDLTKEIEVDKEKFVPMDRLGFYAKHSMGIKWLIYNIERGDIEHKFASKLFEWHFDIFNLIPANLAIDVNTLNK